MDRIEQRYFESGDCGVACVAMVIGKEYDFVEQLFRDNGLVSDEKYFTFHKDIIYVLESLGYTVKRRRFISWKYVDLPAIVKVNPRAGNYWHWVVLAGERKLLDPKPGAPKVITDFRGIKGAGYYLQIVKNPS